MTPTDMTAALAALRDAHRADDDSPLTTGEVDVLARAASVLATLERDPLTRAVLGSLAGARPTDAAAEKLRAESAPEPPLSTIVRRVLDAVPAHHKRATPSRIARQAGLSVLVVQQVLPTLLMAGLAQVDESGCWHRCPATDEPCCPGEPSGSTNPDGTDALMCDASCTCSECRMGREPAEPCCPRCDSTDVKLHLSGDMFCATCEKRVAAPPGESFETVVAAVTGDDASEVTS